MKTKKILIALFLLSFGNILGQNSQPRSDEEVLKYLAKQVLALGQDRDSTIFISLCTDEIKYKYAGDLEVSYWKILKKYYPDATKESLRKMVSEAPEIDGRNIKGSPTLIFPDSPLNKPSNLLLLQKVVHYKPIYSISNLIYSKDGNTCIIYVKVNRNGGEFSIEIFKNPYGKWASHTTTTDWLE